jgi:hypothetical protein
MSARFYRKLQLRRSKYLISGGRFLLWKRLVAQLTKIFFVFYEVLNLPEAAICPLSSDKRIRRDFIETHAGRLESLSRTPGNVIKMELWKSVHEEGRKVARGHWYWVFWNLRLCNNSFIYLTN